MRNVDEDEKERKHYLYPVSAGVVCLCSMEIHIVGRPYTTFYNQTISNNKKKSKRKIKEKKLRMKEIYTVHIDVNTTEAFMIHIFEKISLEYI